MSNKITIAYKKEDSSPEDIISQISEIICSADCNHFLTNLLMAQAYHSKVKIQEIKGLGTNKETGEKEVKTEWREREVTGRGGRGLGATATVRIEPAFCPQAGSVQKGGERRGRAAGGQTVGR